MAHSWNLFISVGAGRHSPWKKDCLGHMAETKEAANQESVLGKELICQHPLSGQKWFLLHFVVGIAEGCVRLTRSLSLSLLSRKPVQRLLLHVLQRPLHLREEPLRRQGRLRRPLGREELQRQRVPEPPSQRVHSGLPGSPRGLQGERRRRRRRRSKPHPRLAWSRIVAQGLALQGCTPHCWWYKRQKQSISCTHFVY